ncbi:hypothetical protein ACA910_022102 [Epithemia clementina (nom. ined.)]
MWEQSVQGPYHDYQSLSPSTEDTRSWRRNRLQFLREVRTRRVEKYKNQLHNNASNTLQYLKEIREARFGTSTEAASDIGSFLGCNFDKNGGDNALQMDQRSVTTASTFCDESTLSSTRYEESSACVSSSIYGGENTNTTFHDTAAMGHMIWVTENESSSIFDQSRLHEASQLYEGFGMESQPGGIDQKDEEEGILAIMESIPEESLNDFDDSVPDDDEISEETPVPSFPDDGICTKVFPVKLDIRESSVQEEESINTNMCSKDFLMIFCPFPHLDEAEPNVHRSSRGRSTYRRDECAGTTSEHHFGLAKPEWLAQIKDCQTTKKKRPEWLASWKDFLHVTGNPEWMASWKDLYSVYDMGCNNKQVSWLSEFEDQSCGSDERSLSSERDALEENAKKPWRPMSAIGAQIYFSAPLSRLHSTSHL